MKLKSKYDLVFLTNTPSFYKLNLCHEIAKERSLLIVFLGYSSEAVNKQITTDNTYNFDSLFINDGNIFKRSKLKCFFSLMKLLKTIRYKKLLITGWYIPEFIISLFIYPKSKNVLISESTLFENKNTGIIRLIKSLLINRTNTALVSGTPHKKLLEYLKYKGKIKITGGVGIINKSIKTNRTTKPINGLRYLYIGRLIEVKNLKFLIEQFNKTGKHLTIVGNGHLESDLRKMAKKNIHFIGFVPNEELSKIFNDHHIFILPSISEPWGLVVDEALYHGLPAIVSSNVGCSIDLIEKTEAGLIFNSNDPKSFNKSINLMESNYSFYSRNAITIDFKKRDLDQVKVYTDLLPKI